MLHSLAFRRTRTVLNEMVLELETREPSTSTAGAEYEYVQFRFPVCGGGEASAIGSRGTPTTGFMA
jgi:hypothetical protein